MVYVYTTMDQPLSRPQQTTSVTSARLGEECNYANYGHDVKVVNVIHLGHVQSHKVHDVR